MHNDFSREIPPVFEIFSNRMEFTSYGGLIQGQSEEDFFSCSSMPRNRELMRVFKDVGLVEQLGSGMSRILRFYKRDIFQISDHFIKVVFLFSSSKENIIIAIGDNNGDNDGDKNTILNLLKKEPAFTAKELSEQTGVSARKISRLVRELQPLLGYAKWDNFLIAIKRAILACENAGGAVADHFPEAGKMVDIGSGAVRTISDYALTRYACHLIAQNGDPRKDEIAFAQSYFAVQTRKQEIIYERGVDDAGFGRIRSKGDQALFGGYTTKDMKARLEVKENRPLADFCQP